MEFELKTCGDLSYFHLPSIEQAGVIHGFMTRSSDAIIRDQSERDRFVETLGVKEIIILDQEHGDQIHIISAQNQQHQAGDGLILAQRGIIGVIKTADCLPVILYEPQAHLAAVVHAGWRGTAARITEKAVHTMIGMGAQPDKMTALIGPGIGPCCYEVGEEVQETFDNNRFPSHIFELKGSSLYLDLKGANRVLLEESNVGEIYDVNLCTMCRGDLFCSARRDKNRDRLVNFVLLAH